MNIPPASYAALGAILAALIAGFFSFLNLVSAKETKISEFRLSWINGLRNEISEFASAIHELVRILEREDKLSDKEFLEVGAEPFKLARESLSKIQLRLNPEHVKNHPDGAEAKLMAEIQIARDSLNTSDYDKVIDACDSIRETAAPLLKQEWEKVKAGELGYRRIRTAAWTAISSGIVLLLVGAGWLIFFQDSRASPVEQEKVRVVIEPCHGERLTANPAAQGMLRDKAAKCP